MIKHFTVEESLALLGGTIECINSFPCSDHSIEVGGRFNVTEVSGSYESNDICLGVSVEKSDISDPIILRKKDYLNNFRLIDHSEINKVSNIHCSHFTQQEAACLFGLIVECKKEFYIKHSNSFMTSGSMKKGEKALALMFEKIPDMEGIFVSLKLGLEVDGVDYISLHKNDFESYFSVLLPVEFSYLQLQSM